MLLFLLVTGALVWMHVSIRQMERGVVGEALKKLPELPEMEEIHKPEHVGALSGAVLTDWRPEDRTFWETSGRAIARRNLWISIPALLLSFAIWQVWSVVVAKLPSVGFKFTTDQLFWLAALPGISGAVLRIFYSFMVPIFGGRLWTTLATWSLMIPAVGIGYAVQTPITPYPVFLALALLCGFGGGNFASSMANISFFFPRAEKGNALALNAGLGNLGVSVVQFVVPIVITAGVFGWLGGDPAMVASGTQQAPLWLQNAGFIWVPFIAASAFAAWFGMNDIASAKASFADQAVIFQRKHNWIMCWLYTGTFGSFIGYSAGFPLLAKTQFPDRRRAAIRLHRPAGRRAVAFGDRLGFRQMGRRARHLVGVRPDDDRRARDSLLPRHQGPARRVLGLLRDVPGAVLRDRRRQRLDLPDDPEHHAQGNGPADAGGRRRDPRMRQAEKESAAITGFTSAIAAFGAFFIPKSYGTSIDLTGGVQAALWGFFIFYVTCVVVTWAVYTRKGGLLHDVERGGRIAPAAPARRIRRPRMSHFLDRLSFFTRAKAEFADGHGVMTTEDRSWEDGYRKRWQHDKIVRSTHGVNCTGSCSWKVYVKGGIVTWETQQTDYPRTRPGTAQSRTARLRARRQL